MPGGVPASRGAPTVGVRAFVFTDVEGSTAAWEREPDAMVGAMARLAALIDDVADAHGGQRAVEQGAGDSAVLVFESPSRALEAAAALQRCVLDEAWPTSEPLAIRAAVHAGEVRQSADGTFAGPTMNRCGRLVAAAHGGQLVASASTIELAGDLPPGLEVVDLGVHALRGIEQPMRVAQVCAEGVPRAFPPLRTVDASAAALPRYRTPLFGQDVLLDELVQLVGGGGIVTLVGTGGCGKTRLAAEAAAQAVESFRDGAAWIDLADLQDGDLVPDAAAGALGVRRGSRPLAERVVEHLRARNVLVVVDNCEHLVDAAADLVVSIRDDCPEVTVLATSREPLNVSEEVIRRVPSLVVPQLDTADALEASPAGALLLDRVRRARPDLELGAGDVSALAELCRRLDGIPLALELAAARLRVATPRSVLDGLAERFRLLTGGGRNTLARQRTLEASVAWSYQLLSGAEATVFRRLCAFAGPFDQEAALVVAGGGLRDAEVVDAVSSLVDRSLLHEATEGRRRMLETLRHFARERLVESGEANEVRDRHLRWAVEACADLEARLEGPELHAELDALDPQIDDLRAAMRWALDTGRADDAVSIVAPAAWHWILRGRMAEALGWIEQALAPGQAASPAAQLQAWWARLQLLAHHDAAHDELERAWEAGSELAGSLGDRRLEARLSVWWGSHLGFNRPEAGIALLEEAHERCRATGDWFWAGYAEGSLALCNVFRGRDDLADAHLRAMSASRAAHGSTRLWVDELTRRAVVDYALGRYDAVVESASLVAHLLDGVSEINVQGTARAVAGWVEVERGGPRRVAEEMEALLARYLADREMQHVPSILLALSRALLAEGRPEEATSRLQLAWPVPELQSFVRARLWFRHDLAVAELLAGRPASAVAGFEELLDDATRVGNPQEQARAHFWLGRLARQDGEHVRAEAHLHTALDLHAGHGYRQMAAGALEAIAGIELDHGRAAAAVRLLGAADAVRAEAGVVLRVGWQVDHDADLGRARASLDAPTFADEWARGAELGLTGAVELARRGRGERGRPTFGWDSLTATEAKIAGLLGQGRTNPEIADALLMGRETVKTHVSSILRKLGLSNRTQVASALAGRAATLPR